MNVKTFIVFYNNESGLPTGRVRSMLSRAETSLESWREANGFKVTTKFKRSYSR